MPEIRPCGVATATATSPNPVIVSLGNVRAETLTAFSAEEFGKILAKMP